MFEDLVLRRCIFQASKAKTDEELLAVSCLLHDLGMTEQHYQHHANCRCFAGHGAYAAKDWSIQRGWQIPRADQLFDAISMHMNPFVALDDGVEAHLLQQAASCDVIGSRGFEFSTTFRTQLNQQYPRLDFNQHMIEFINMKLKLVRNHVLRWWYKVGLNI